MHVYVCTCRVRVACCVACIVCLAAQLEELRQRTLAAESTVEEELEARFQQQIDALSREHAEVERALQATIPPDGQGGPSTPRSTAEADLELSVMRDRAAHIEREKARLEREKEEALLQARRAKEQRARDVARMRKELDREKREHAKEARRLTAELYEAQQALLQANLAINAGGVPVMLDRYVDNNPAGFELQYGTVQDFRDGLEGLLGATAPTHGELMAAIESEHCERSDSDRYFEVYNYGTVTTSRVEFFFVVEPTEQRLAELNLKEWPPEIKLQAAGRPCRKPMALRAFRKARARIDADLRAAGDAGLHIEEFIAARLCTRWPDATPHALAAASPSPFPRGGLFHSWLLLFLCCRAEWLSVAVHAHRSPWQILALYT